MDRFDAFGYHIQRLAHNAGRAPREALLYSLWAEPGDAVGYSLPFEGEGEFSNCVTSIEGPGRYT